MKKILIIFCTLLSLASTGTSQNLDIRILRKINLDRPRSMDHAFYAVTNTAKPLAVALPVGMWLTGLIGRDSALKWNAVQMAGGLALSTALTEGLKYTIRRRRPYVSYPDIESRTTMDDPSFPSGHTAVAFSVATSLSLQYPKWYVITPAYVWAVTVAYSRMDLGAHYPSDVLAGALIGAGAAWLCYKGQQWLNKKHTGR